MIQPAYNYVNIAPPTVSVDQITGINDTSQVVGFTPFGMPFVYNGGTYALLPFFSGTTGGINDQGQIVGWAHQIFDLGFIYSAGMWIGGFHYPGNNFGTHFGGINDFGHIVGSVIGATENGSDFVDLGFIYSGNTYVPLQYPSAGVTHANGINNGGQVVGYYSDNLTGVAHGFLYSGGGYTTLDDPLATAGTYLNAINNTGQIVGYYNDGSGQHGFLYSGTFTTLDNPLGVGTSLTGINDYGQIVGNYIDGAGNSHGFLGTLAFSAAIAATTVYTNEYGFAPGARELNGLLEFTTSQYVYGQQIGVMDPAVYAHEALGVALQRRARYF